MKKLAGLLVSAALAGCASGNTSYNQPAVHVSSENAKTVESPRETVWNASVPELGKQYFVINNLDKSSGLINVSYAGDPEKYVDCGQITSYVKNARGERTYQFPGSSAQENYEMMDQNALFQVQRKMNLEGRVNLIFEEIGPNQTLVTANTLYVLTKQSIVRIRSIKHLS